MSILEVKNVSKSFGGVQANVDISVSVEQGSIVGLIGPNGSGKTTLLKAINREIYPASKNNSWIKIFEKKVWNVWQLRSMIGIVINLLSVLVDSEILL